MMFRSLILSISFLILFLKSSYAESPTPSVETPTSVPAKFDVNDVSFLFPVPKNKADVDRLISADDLLADGTTQIWPEDLFQQVLTMAKNVKFNDDSIIFPPELEKRHSWKVAGIRVNPASVGESVLGHPMPIIPGVRLIMQPVTVNGDTVKVHDFAAHVVFNFVLPLDPPQPDAAAFRPVIDDLLALKKLAEDAHVQTAGSLNVHPALSADVSGFRERLRDMLRKNLRRDRFQVVSFMGIQSPEPWIFFSVIRDQFKDTPFMSRPVGGFSDGTKAQMLKLISGPPVVPVATPNGLEGKGASTAPLFAVDLQSHLDDTLYAEPVNPALKGLKLRDVADFVANPRMQNTAMTDCISCHTETTRRQDLSLSPSAIAFKRPEGISGVATDMLPKKKNPNSKASWNVRNFGWFPDFFSGGATIPTVTRRAANEAAESAAFINRKILAEATLTPTPVQPSN